MQLVPYAGGAFQGVAEYARPAQPPTITHPGQAVGLYITLHPEAVEEAAAKFATWFSRRSWVKIVDMGTSDKVKLGFVIMEWLECDVDELFLDILDAEEIVADYTLYGRALEG